MRELTRNAVHVLPEGELERKLAGGRPLRVKLGIDVTSPDIHVGRAIPLQRMRAFQDEGHTGVLIVGDYTTQDRRPVRALERAADPLRRGDRPERPVLRRAGVPDPRPGSHRGALQRRVAREARLRRDRPADPRRDGGGAPHPRRLPQAVRERAADLGLRAPLSAGPGLRLGGRRSRRRARGDRPALQPPDGPGA